MATNTLVTLEKYLAQAKTSAGNQDKRKKRKKKAVGKEKDQQQTLDKKTTNGEKEKQKNEIVEVKGSKKRKLNVEAEAKKLLVPEKKKQEILKKKKLVKVGSKKRKLLQATANHKARTPEVPQKNDKPKQDPSQKDSLKKKVRFPETKLELERSLEAYNREYQLRLKKLLQASSEKSDQLIKPKQQQKEQSDQLIKPKQQQKEQGDQLIKPKQQQKEQSDQLIKPQQQQKEHQTKLKNKQKILRKPNRAEPSSSQPGNSKPNQKLSSNFKNLYPSESESESEISIFGEEKISDNFREEIGLKWSEMKKRAETQLKGKKSEEIKGNLLLNDKKKSNSVELAQNIELTHKEDKKPLPNRNTSLQERLKKRLSEGRFRWINEQLYKITGSSARQLFDENPITFAEYHDGFRSVVESWPANPVDIFINYLKTKSSDSLVADLGCGEAKIAQEAPNKILSFDLIAKHDRIIACDIAKLPVPDCLFDIAIFSLSLMGTNYIDFLKEAHRTLKPNGELKIAEVVSRFSDMDAFVNLLGEIGFKFIDKA
ncbi:hypothetical protein G9A89_014269 [Geosiphon pyriformis]|nr:hypothetical protein G9A89_014269 [Geosiphon pyriformis]